jgi:SAM-dependent methyltransferase
MGVIPQATRVLDVGCGHGRYAIALAEAGHTVVAYDVSGRMLELLESAKGELPIETRMGNAHRLSARDGEFDAVFSNDFMPHFPDWPDLLLEQARVCRAGGLVVFSISFQEHRGRAALALSGEFEHDYSPDLLSEKPFWAETSYDGLEKAAEAAGLVVRALHPLKFFSDSHLFGRALGTATYAAARVELARRLGESAEVLRFYSWLETAFLQRLPFYASNLTLVVLEKPAQPDPLRHAPPVAG